MQGSLTLVRFPIRAFVMALIAAAVLVLGAAGGYWLRGNQAPVSAPTVSASTISAGSGGALVQSSGAAFDSGTHRSGTQY